MLGGIEQLIAVVTGFIWLLYIFGLYLALHVIQNWSYRVSLAIWLLLDLVKNSITPHTLTLNGICQWFANVVKYPSLMLLGGLSLYLVLYFHQKNNTKPEKESALICMFILVFVLLNAVRFFDSVIFNSELLADAYTFSIIFIKLIAAFAILYQVRAIRLREQGVSENWKL